MKIFISWSGEWSHATALILRDWLPTVIDGIEPWVSSEDIQKGSRWSTELAKELDSCSLGIICINPSNADSPWLNFEAGALSKSVEDGRVFPILFRMEASDLKGPLNQFQTTVFNEEDMYKLVLTISYIVDSSYISTERLRKVVGYSWTALSSMVGESMPNHHERLGQKKSSKIQEKTIESLDQDDRLSEIEEDILLALASFAEDVSVESSNISKVLKIPIAKVRYYLKRLEKEKLIGYIDDDDFGNGYFITHKGTGYLIKHALI